MFLPLFYSFLGFLEFKNLVEPIFDMREFTRKNFSSKFWFWEKMMAVPPRSKLVQKIWGCRHVQYLSKMLKIGFVFLGNRFRVKDLLLGTVSKVSPEPEINLVEFCTIVYSRTWQQALGLVCSTTEMHYSTESQPSNSWIWWRLNNDRFCGT